MTNKWFAILKSNLKSVFNINPVASENFFHPNFFVFCNFFLGPGGDENTVNFLNIRTPKKFVVITLKFELCGSSIE